MERNNLIPLWQLQNPGYCPITVADVAAPPQQAHAVLLTPEPPTCHLDFRWSHAPRLRNKRIKLKFFGRTNIDKLSY